MLKKAILIGVTATAAALSIAGVAFAHDSDDGANTTCNATEQTKQSNHGDQLVGGNLDVNRIAGGVLTGQVDKVPAVCPSVANGNDIG